MNKLYVITGPAGIGKSTVSYEIGKRLEKSVVIEGDTIYNFFVGGRISPWKQNAPLDLFWNICFILIESYLKNGYDVVFNYIIKNNNLNKINDRFREYEITFKCLLASEEIVIKRDLLRPSECQMHERCLILLKEFIDCNFNDKYIIDTSNLTIEETVKKIME